MSSVALGVTPPHFPPEVEKSDIESGVFGVERLPLGIIQGPPTLVEFLVTTVNEPGAKTPERGRRRLRAVKTTIVGLEKTALGRVLYSWSWRSIRYIVSISISGSL